MRNRLFAPLVCAVFALAYVPVFGAENSIQTYLRCGSAPLTGGNRALWSVLGEWEGRSGSGTTSLLHLVGCDGRILVFRRPANGNGRYFQTTLSSHYRFVYAPNPYVINVSTPEDPDYPEKQVGMTLHNKNTMTFNIELFDPIVLTRTSREICLQSAHAIKESAEIAILPQHYFPEFSELVKEERALWRVFVAIEKRDSWSKAKQKVSDALEKAGSGTYVNLETGDETSIITHPVMCLNPTNGGDCLVYMINIGSHVLAISIVAMIAAETDEYVRTLLQSPETPNLQSFIARFGGMLNEIKRIQEYYWENIEIIRNNQCREKYGRSGSYPNSSLFPRMPYPPIEVEQYLPAPGATKEEHMANSVSALIEFSKGYQGYQ